MDMTRLLSRTPGRDADRRNTNDEWGKTHGSGIWITGRTVLNIWRLMRSELKLCSYTLQVWSGVFSSSDSVPRRTYAYAYAPYRLSQILRSFPVYYVHVS